MSAPLAKSFQPLTGPLVRGVGEGGVGFNPMSLFASGEQGALYYFDPSFAGLYQDSAGTTPVTAVEQPVGKMLDRRFGFVRGVELCTNGDFSDGAAGWTGNANCMIAASVGQMVITNTTGGGEGFLTPTSALAPTAGKTYEIVFDLIASSRAPAVTLGGVRLGLSAGVGQKRCVITATSAANLFIGVGEPTAGSSQTVDNVSVKEIPGNLATQSTSAARSVLSARKNLLLGTTTLVTQSVTLAATPYTLSFTGTGTVTLSGASTAGPLVGGGSLTFTPTAGSVTFTVTGSVTNAQLEYGSTATRYQRVNTATDYDTAGFPLLDKYDDIDDARTTTFASSLGAACTVARAIPVTGAQILTGQTIGTSFTNSTTCGALVIVNRALTTAETTQLTNWLNARVAS